jgi:hypothetical protein
VEDRALSAAPLAWAWTLAAGGAAHAALVVAPALALRSPPATGWWLSVLVGPALLGLGLLRRNRAALLVGVPAGWALPAHGLPPAAPEPALALVGLAAVAAYVPAACWFLAPRPVPNAIEWTSLDGAAAPAARDPVPWVAGLVVAGPAVGAACWPALAEASGRGFPALPGLALVGIAFVGTLVGLAIATDLFRGRAPLPGSRARLGVLGVLATLLAGLLAAIGG